MPTDATARSDHFRQGGSAYARHRPTYPAPMATALADLAPCRDLAVDVGCGSGQLAHRLASVFDRVEAFDISRDQIAHAPPHPAIRYAVARAEALPVRPATACLVTVAQAAHWFDLPRFYAEARRIAVPGAVLALVTYGVPTVEGPLADRFARFYWQDLAGHWPPERRHVETGYAGLPFPFEERVPPALDIQRSWSLDALLGYVDTWSAVKHARAQGQSARIDTFVGDARRLWGEPDTCHKVTWPIRMRLGRL